MTNKITIRTGSRTNEDVTFDLRDSKGRVIGATFWFCPVEVVESKRSHMTCLDHVALGTKLIEARWQVTRNGVEYGASHGSKLFATVEEAREAFKTYLVGARKRAEKRAA
jgi:hypothetical protein